MVLLNVLVLAPLALVSVYWVAVRIGGRLLGASTVAVWLLGRGCCPYSHSSPTTTIVRDHVLPLVLGLTAEPAFPAAVALVSSAALIATSLDRRTLTGAAFAGLVAGAAVAIEPRSLLFLGAAAGAYVAARRVPEAVTFALALAPAVLAVVLWQRVRSPAPTLSRYGPVDWGQFTGNMEGLREYFWSQRLLQWLPLAGAIAVARRSVPLALLIGGWMLSYGVVLGSQPGAGLDGGGIFRVLAARAAGVRPPRGRDAAARPDTRCPARHAARSAVAGLPSRLERAGRRGRPPRIVPLATAAFGPPRPSLLGERRSSSASAARGSCSGRRASRSPSSSAAARARMKSVATAKSTAGG